MSSVEKNIKIALIFFLNQVFKIQHVFNDTLQSERSMLDRI